MFNINTERESRINDLLTNPCPAFRVEETSARMYRPMHAVLGMKMLVFAKTCPRVKFYLLIVVGEYVLHIPIVQRNVLYRYSHFTGRERKARDKKYHYPTLCLYQMTAAGTGGGGCVD